MAAFISIKTCISSDACVDGIIRALQSKPDSTSIDEPLALHDLSECTHCDLVWATQHSNLTERQYRAVRRGYLNYCQKQRSWLSAHRKGAYVPEKAALARARRSRLNTLLRCATQYEDRGPGDAMLLSCAEYEKPSVRLSGQTPTGFD